MKKLVAAFTFVVLVAGFASLAHAGLDDFLRRVDAKAREDMGKFSVSLSAQFGVPVPRIDEIIKHVPAPADAFMVLQLGQMSNKPPEAVLPVVQAHRSKGWGAIAQELGIKPGSREFHALKRGDLHFAGESGGDGGHGRGKGKGKKH